MSKPELEKPRRRGGFSFFGQVLLAKQYVKIPDFWIENWSLKIGHWQLPITNSQ
jgi:hypothetical protein